MQELDSRLAYKNDICPKCTKNIGAEGRIYYCEIDDETYHKDCGGLNKTKVDEAAEAVK